MPAPTFLFNTTLSKLHLLLTRPYKDSEALEGLLDKIGIQSTIEPLLDIHTLNGPDLICHNVAALAMTSANGVRAFAARSKHRGIPVYAVGDSTARAAKSNGFLEVYSASGTVDQLAALIIHSLIPNKGKVLHPAARDIAGDLGSYLREAGFFYQREVIYEAVPAQILSPMIVKQIHSGEIDGVVLFSPRTGHIFKVLAKKAGLIDDLITMRAYCLSPAVAETIKDLSWLEVLTAKKPNQAALLELVGTL